MATRKPDGEGVRGCIINTASIAAYDGQIGQVSISISSCKMFILSRFSFSPFYLTLLGCLCGIEGW